MEYIVYTLIEIALMVIFGVSVYDVIMLHVYNKNNN